MLQRFTFIFLIAFFNLSVASAAVVINEIMYDLDGIDIDYVEVKNDGSEDLDLSTFKLLISNSTSNHSINFSSGNTILRGGDIGIIVVTSSLDNYISKWTNVGNIFTSSFSLPNSSTENTKVEINAGEKDVPISSVSYSSSLGASSDGNSLQLIGGSWTPALPTPNMENQNSTPAPSVQENNTNTSSSSDGGSSSSGGGSSSTTYVQPKIKTKIVTKNVVFSGVAFPLKAVIKGYNGEEVHSGKYFWNFGDGGSAEYKNDEIFNYTYLYPGDYSLSMEYYLNIYSQIPESIEKIKIKVVPLELSISKVGDEKDFFIELTNNSSYEIDVSLWQITSLNKTFTLPRNTNILAKNKITLSSELTQFNPYYQKDLKLLTPNGKVVFEYGKNVLPASNLVKKENNSQENVTLTSKTTNQIQVEDLSVSLVSSADNLSANIMNTEQDDDSSNNSHLLWITLSVLIAFGGGAVYFIQKSKSPFSKDFEILDE